MGKATKTLENTQRSTDKINQFLDLLLTKQRINTWDNYIQSQAESTRSLTNQMRIVGKQYRIVGGITARTIRDFVQPAIADIEFDVRSNLLHLNLTLDELRRQIKQNGDEAHLLLASTDRELTEILRNLAATSGNLQVITNDPNLQRLVSNSAATTGNIEIITKDLADISTWVADSTARQPPAKGVLQKFERGVIKVFKVLTGAGNIIYLIQQVY